MPEPKAWKGFHPCTVILFDLDDTILDFSGGAETCWQTACTDASATRVDLSASDLRRAIKAAADLFWSDTERHRLGGLDLRAATRAIVSDAMRQCGIDDVVLAQEIADTYRDLREDSVSLFEGAEATLECLRSEGFRLGLITNGHAAGQRARIVRFGVGRHFDYIGIEGELGIGKPHPPAYLAALRALGTEPQTAWMVGDNFEWDVAAPQRLGMRAVWVNAPGLAPPPRADKQPDHVIRTIAELVTT